MGTILALAFPPLLAYIRAPGGTVILVWNTELMSTPPPPEPDCPERAYFRGLIGEMSAEQLSVLKVALEKKLSEKDKI